jgi:predicted anti-sigma-YlaC factor YlaD
MTCTKLKEVYEGTAPEAAYWNFEYIVTEHLDTCQDCQAYYKSRVASKHIEVLE